jgi:hypothetical protein
MAEESGINRKGVQSDYGRRGPPPNGLTAGVDDAESLSVIPVTTRSPSFSPSKISVVTPSLIPVLIVTFVGTNADPGKT